MNSFCCIPGASDQFKDVLECDVKEDEEGILVSIRTKDKNKSGMLKEYFRSSKELFGNVCGCC